VTLVHLDLLDTGQASVFCKKRVAVIHVVLKMQVVKVGRNDAM